MNKLLSIVALTFFVSFTYSQNVGILRKNYISSYYDSVLMIMIDQFDSATVQLGAINPTTGVITSVNNTAFNSGINLNGATIDPYLNRYYIGSGFNLMTFDITGGNLINTAPITGPIPSGSFQNYRFNPSDSTIYGMVPNNFYSTYYDPISMSNIEVLDSSHIRFGSIDPVTGNYTLIGNTPYKNIYTLAGNSIDPHQMIYYYSAVDTLVGIDLYTGNLYSEATIQLPNYAIFENITYSCADTSIYGITRQNYISLVYDSLVMDFVETVDSTTFRLSKIDPSTGIVTFISPNSIPVGANLNGGTFIDPSTMTFYLNTGNLINGVSMVTGLITSSVLKTFPNGETAFDMMRSTQNCFGAAKMREETILSIEDPNALENYLVLFPNPANNELNISTKANFQTIEIMDVTGKFLLKSTVKTVNIVQLPEGIYFAKITTSEGESVTRKFVKQ
jgi:Secretion system C-terminal sorting domain